MQLYQAEWCPYSHRVRQRLTELGIDFQARQVAADKDDRDDLEQATGSRGIPVLVPDGDQQPITGTDEIIAYLDSTYSESAQADRHREKAAAHS